MGARGRLFIAVLALIGLAFIAVGIIYLAAKAGSLPSFIPGHIAGSSAHRTNRGWIAVGIGVGILLIARIVAELAGRRR